MQTIRIVGGVLAIWFLICGIAFSGQIEAYEKGQADFETTPPRLSYIDGHVSFSRPEVAEWSEARVNIPAAPGDKFSTGRNGNLELQIATGSYLRAGGNTRITLINHEPDYIQFGVDEGDVSLDIRTPQSDQSFEIDTPHGAMVIKRAGYYRVDVREKRTSFTAYRSGEAVIFPEGGDKLRLAHGQEVWVRGNNPQDVGIGQARGLDSWDRWGLSRTDFLLDAASVRYVSSDIYGIKDLDRAGVWEVAPEYGPVWIPTEVSDNWAPYSSGSWIRDPVYGWTWVDSEEWGWAPFHYGRWVFLHGRWAWAPGPPVGRAVYAPALVAFFESGENTTAPDYDLRVGWVALGWGEPLLPWWRRVHRPWWGGWGGPRHRDVERTRRYENMHVGRAMVVVKKSNFAHGPVKRLRLAKSKMGFGLGPVSSGINGASPSKSRGIRPSLPHHVKSSPRGPQYLNQTISGARPLRVIIPLGKTQTKGKKFSKGVQKHIGPAPQSVVPLSRYDTGREDRYKRHRIQKFQPSKVTKQRSVHNRRELAEKKREYSHDKTKVPISSPVFIKRQSVYLHKKR